MRGFVQTLRKRTRFKEGRRGVALQCLLLPVQLWRPIHWPYLCHMAFGCVSGLEVYLPESYPEGGTIIPASYATLLFGICRVPALVQKDSPHYSVPCSCHPTLLGMCCCDSTRTWTVPTHALICCTVQKIRRST